MGTVIRTLIIPHRISLQSSHTQQAKREHQNGDHYFKQGKTTGNFMFHRIPLMDQMVRERRKPGTGLT